MTLLIDPTRPMPSIQPSTAPVQPSLPMPASPEIEQWVIEEARRRQRRRRLGIAWALTLAAAAAVAIMGFVSSHRAGSPRPRPNGPQAQPAGVGGVRAPLRRRSDAGVARVFPALGAGQVGWKMEVSAPRGSGGADCCGLLTHEAEVRDGSPVPHAKGWWNATVLAARGVTAVSVEGRKPVSTQSAGLPYGLRFATVTVRSLNVKPVAFNAHGTPIREPRTRARARSHASDRLSSLQTWRSPATPPSGSPCQITATSIPGLTPLEGAVTGRVNAYRSLGGPGFQSCANTVYRFEGHTLDSAILLDAEHPGSKPAPLPGMEEDSKADTFQAPDGSSPLGLGGAAGAAMSNQWRLRLTAKRVPGAWLVVAGGTATQRRALIADLDANTHITTSR